MKTLFAALALAIAVGGTAMTAVVLASPPAAASCSTSRC